MTLSRAVDVAPPVARSPEIRVWIVAALVASLWLEVLLESAHGSTAGSLAPGAAAWAGLAAQTAFTAAEAFVAAGAWRLVGREPRWRALAPRLLAVSSVEAFAVAVTARQLALPSALAIVLAGPRAAATVLAGSGAAFAFSAFGALALLRLALSAHVQARVADAPLRYGLGIVAVLYLATRLGLWWTFDLMQGRSFESAGGLP